MITKFKLYEEKSRDKEIVYTFKTKAVSSGNYEYPIHLLEGNPKFDTTNGISYNGLVISIDKTPGSWYVATFLHNQPGSQYGNDIMIDAGQNWKCTNKQEIIKELKYWLDNYFIGWKEGKKFNI
jgi:hypothetical protein